MNKLHLCTVQNLAMYRESVSTFAGLSSQASSEQHLAERQEGSFLAPKKSSLFGDTIEKNLVRGPGCKLVVATDL